MLSEFVYVENESKGIYFYQLNVYNICIVDLLTLVQIFFAD